MRMKERGYIKGGFLYNLRNIVSKLSFSFKPISCNNLTQLLLLQPLLCEYATTANVCSDSFTPSRVLGENYTKSLWRNVCGSGEAVIWEAITQVRKLVTPEVKWRPWFSWALPLDPFAGFSRPGGRKWSSNLRMSGLPRSSYVREIFMLARHREII